MSDPWTFTGQPTVEGLAGGAVSLVEGTSFSISSPGGDIDPGGAQGLFFEDTRFLSQWRLRLDERAPQGLACITRHPFAATFVARGQPRPGQADSTLLVERRRYVGNGMREEVVITNLGREAAHCTVTFELDTDFAHIFEVKEHRVRQQGHHAIEIRGPAMGFTYRLGEISRRLDVVFPDGAHLTPGRARLDIVVPAKEQWSTHFEFRVTVDGAPVELPFGDAEETSPAVALLEAWEQAAPRIRTAHPSLDATFTQSSRDLGALRIPDPERRDRMVIAAGAPWFMTLFGRDALISSLMILAVDPSLAANTLHTLARMQGTHVDPRTEEQPGKILHELRRGLTTVAETPAGSIYYGSVDATPLFVVVLGALHRWGAPDDVVRELLPHADRALAWVEEHGDRDGDGFVEYQRSSEHGLANQGWKDSFDAVGFADGRLADTPIALCEVQGYVYAAYLARAQIARHLGDAATAVDLEERASRLKAAFNRQFWLEGSGHYALGLDREKRPIDALTSNIGHCLWSGIVDEDKAARTVEQLCGPEMFTGWGIRTLASSMRRYNPVSYHNGSVWPHDSAICAAGLARYGFHKEAEAVTVGLFEAAAAFGGRLPELFCGFDRDTFPMPVSYPSSCAPQAWAAASPFWLLRTTLLGLEPSVPDGVVRCAPRIPGAFGRMDVGNLPLADARISIVADGRTPVVRGLPDGVELTGSASPA